MTNDHYNSDYARKRALIVLNRGEQECHNILKRLEEISKEVEKRRLEFVYVRTVVYGRGKGKTGRRKREKQQ